MALVPVTLFGMWNVGYQANSAIAKMDEFGIDHDGDWHYTIHQALGFTNDAGSIADNFVLGALLFIPMYIVCMFVGGHIELIFSVLRGHEINEGFLVTGLLFPLTLPPTIPLWQVAIGIAFGVVVAKEVFGGTGRNFLNVALTSRAFLYFSYSAQISGDKVWTAVDGFSGATALGQMANVPEGGNAIDSLSSISYVWGETEPLTWTAVLSGYDPGLLRRNQHAVVFCRRRDLDCHRDRILENHGRRDRRRRRHIDADEHRLANQHQPDVWGAVLLAHGDRRTGIWFGLHGDRPGQCLDDRQGKMDLRWIDRFHDRVDPRRQSCVSRRDHAGDLVRKCVRTANRLLRCPSQCPQEDCTLCHHVIPSAGRC